MHYEQDSQHNMPLLHTKYFGNEFVALNGTALESGFLKNKIMFLPNVRENPPQRFGSKPDAVKQR